MASETTQSLDKSVLWDVVEEHLDELEFGLAQFERALDHPLRTLDDVARGAESRMLAHLDGLVIAGPKATRILLDPVLSDPTSVLPERIAASALLLVTVGELDSLATFLSQKNGAVRTAAVRGGALAGEGPIDGWALQRLRAPAEQELAGLLELIAARGIEPPNLLAWLQSDIVEVVAAAVRAVRRGNPSLYLSVVEHLLGHSEPIVRLHALVAGMAWGSARAWQVCEHEALASDQASPLAMSLYALSGAPDHHERLLAQLKRPKQRAHALRALGHTGNLGLIPHLLEYLASEVPNEAKLAAQAVATITGLDLGNEEFISAPSAPAAAPAKLPPASEDPEARAALPPLPEDDLDADLVPPPEAALSRPNRDAIRRWWSEKACKFDVKRRHLAGQPISPDAVFGCLARGSLAGRHMAGLALLLYTGGRVWIDTRARSARQRAQLEVARGIGVKFLPNPFGRW